MVVDNRLTGAGFEIRFKCYRFSFCIRNKIVEDKNHSLKQVGWLFRTPAVLARICNEDFAGVLTAPQTEQALSSIHSVWSQMFPLEQQGHSGKLGRTAEVISAVRTLVRRNQKW